jgi:hypothetical protein
MWGSSKSESISKKLLSIRTKSPAKLYSVYYKEGGLPSLLSMVMVGSKGSLGIGVNSIGAALWELSHLWEPVGWLDSQWGLFESRCVMNVIDWKWCPYLST